MPWLRRFFRGLKLAVSLLFPYSRLYRKVVGEQVSPFPPLRYLLKETRKKVGGNKRKPLPVPYDTACLKAVLREVASCKKACQRHF